MAAVQRFLTWVKGSGGTGTGQDNQVQDVQISDFDGLPVEVYGEIFKHLDVENLKVCKQVCRTWNMGLSASKVLLKKPITEWDTHNFEDSFQMDLRFYFNRVKIFTPRFRLIQFGDAAMIQLLPYLTRLDGFQFITDLEIARCTVSIHNFIPIVSKLEALVSLTVEDVHLLLSIEGPGRPNSHLPDSYWPNLKILTIRNKDNSSYLSNCHSSNLRKYCASLEILNFEELTHQSEQRGRRRWLFSSSRDFKTIFMDFFKATRKNSRTLKSASLVTFGIDYDRENPEYTKIQNRQEQVLDRLDNLFIQFMGQLSTFTNWESIGLRLRKLNLCFQLVRLESSQAGEVFFPFLQTQTNLKEFSLSHVHFEGGGQNTIQELLDSLPVDCRIRLEGVMAVRMLILPVLPPNPFGVDMDPHFQHHVLAMHEAISVPRYDDSPIHGYFDSIVELNTINLSLTIRFVCCNSLADINFFAPNLQFLTTIKIRQHGARFRDKIALEDEDIQRIITRATHLTHLCLESCNLEAITDFGLTGIVQEACERMLTTNNFELQDEDKIGSPISAIKNLRSLKLGTVRDHVTDVTAYHAFKGLASLTSFGISKPKITSSGFKELQRLFQFNKVVQFDADTKFQFECIDSFDKNQSAASHPHLAIEN